MTEFDNSDHIDYLDSLDLDCLLALEKKTPEDVDLLVRIGMRYFRLRQLDECNSYYSRALAIDPDDGWTHLYMGNLCGGLSCHDEAITHFQRAIELLPDVACPHWCLADAYGALGVLARTEFHYRRAVEIDPDDPKAKQKLADWIDEYGRAEYRKT